MSTDTTPDVLMAAQAAVPVLPQAYNRTDMFRDFRRVFATDEGRRVLGHLMAWTGMTSPARGSDRMTASEAAIFHEGTRAVGMQLLLHLDRINGRDDEKVIYGGHARG